jgi:hypothetical protein
MAPVTTLPQPRNHLRCARSLRRAARLLGLLVLLTGIPGGWALGQEPALEDQVKAAFIVKFAEYVNWPKAGATPAGGPLRIGVLGDSRITAELRQAVSGRNVQGRPIVLAEAQGPNALDGVHILFIGAEASAGLKRKISALRQRSVLIVTDHPEGLEMGGIINFVTVERRVRFEISLPAANDAGIALSSRLLSVAIRVIKGGLEPSGILLASRIYFVLDGS